MSQITTTNLQPDTQNDENLPPQQHPIITIANKLFPDNPNSFYVNLRDSIKIDIYYNALKAARDHWGFPEDGEKMQIWLDEWWIKTVFNLSSIEQENESLESQEILLNESIEGRLEDPTEIMKIWKQFILQYTKPRIKIELVQDPNAAKKKGKAAAPVETQVTVPALFNVDDVREMTEYLSTTLFQFYDVYKFVFTEERSTTKNQYTHILQQPIVPPSFTSGRIHEEFLAEKEKEEHERLQKIESQKKEEEARLEAIRKEREEQALRELEEREAPRLSSEQLAEIAAYLKFHLSKDLSEKEEGMLGRLNELQLKLVQQEEANTATAAGKKK